MTLPSDPEADGYEQIWRMLLWDNAPERLIQWLGRNKVPGWAQLTADMVAQAAAEDAIQHMAEAIELMKQAEAARRSGAIVSAVKAATQAGQPKLRVRYAAFIVELQLRRDLRSVEWFGMTPHAARDLADELTAAARYAIAEAKTEDLG